MVSVALMVVTLSMLVRPPPVRRDMMCERGAPMAHIKRIPRTAHDALTSESIRAQVALVLGGKTFSNAPQLRKFLEYLAERTIEDDEEGLKEYAAGVEVFKRGATFDPATDTIVRVQARRLRSKLDEYYASEGREDPVRIELPKGRYRLNFSAASTPYKVAVIGPAGPEPLPPPPPKSRWRAGLIVAGVAIMLLGAGLVLWHPFRKPGPPPRLLPLTSYPGREIFPAFSPDGSQVVFSWNGAQREQYDLYLQALGAPSPLRLTFDPEDDLSPAWSPDGRTIAFLRCPRGFATLNMHPRGSAGLYLLSLPAGPERKLADIDAVPVGPHINSGSHITWHPSGEWLVITDRAGPLEPPGLFLVSVASAEKRRLTRPPEHFNADTGPAFSPDARALTFVRSDSFTVSDIYRLDLSDGLAPAGEPRRLTFEKRFAVCPVWSADGRSIRFLSGHLGAAQQMFRIPATGSAQPESIGSMPDNAVFVAHAPQAHRLAVVRAVGDVNIWRIGDSAPFLASTRWDAVPEFSPDGRRIAFVSNRSGSLEIWVARSDGSQPLQLTSVGGPQVGRPTWSPDGEWIAFYARVGGNADIYLIRSWGGVLRRLTDHPSEEARPSWSRDGRWIYHTSQRGGANRIWKTPVEGGDPIPVTSPSATTPEESTDGRFLYFVRTRREGSSLWKVPVAGGEETQVLPSLANDMAFCVTSRGIYFIADDRVDLQRRSIQFLRFSDSSIATIAKLTKRVAHGFAVSPDSRTIVYAQVDQEGTDLALLDNFRW